MGSQLPLKGAQPPVFGPCLLWPNGWMDEDATWYGSRPGPRAHSVRRGPSSPRERGTAAPPVLFSTHVYCGHGRPSQLVLSSCFRIVLTNCPLVMHYWAHLQLAYGLRCYGNITRTRNVSEYVLVLAVCLVVAVDVVVTCADLCMATTCHQYRTARSRT